MKRNDDSPPLWNIFARELQSILARHGNRLGQLDDRAGIHPQKVARLKYSLRVPKFNVLTPDELNSVFVAFHLTNDEQLQLRAAILATSIEATLMSRMNNLDALAAANEILPILYRILHVNVGKPSPLGMVKEIPSMDSLDPLFEAALDILDNAILLLNLSHDAVRIQDRHEFARQAYDEFVEAHARLAALPQSLQSTEAWIVWNDQAIHGSQLAQIQMQSS